MKKTFTKFLFFVLFAFSSFKINAQTICMVTADYQAAENYVVYWEEFSDVSNIDSIYIYRQEGIETSFTKIGAVDVTLTSPTFFVDTDANTMDTTKYAISYLYQGGAESVRSYWHQGVVMDYDDASGFGQLIWTKYKKEDQIDESYIYSYECRMDESGLGMYSTMSVMMNYETLWTDQASASHPTAHYELLVSLPSCSILTKSNINTSRSNIKNQQSNATVLGSGTSGIQNLKGTNYSISPNPASDFITITSDKMINGNVWISDLKGQEFNRTLMEGTSFDFDINALSAGVYFVNIENEGVVTSTKFIKK